MKGDLPEGWTEIEIGKCLHLVNGFAFKPTQWGEKGLPIIRIQNLNNPHVPFNYCDEDLPDKIRVRRGDLLFAWSGTPGTSFGAHIWGGAEAWLNQHIFRVEFCPSLFDRAFLRYAININLNQYIADAHGGAGLAHITKGRFETSTLKLAPLEEQRRIVAQIEALLAKARPCQERLDKVPTIIKRFRQAVLAAACTGKLTEDWRRETQDVRAVQSPINEDRFSWAGSEEDLAELPKGWVWTALGNYARCFRGRFTPRPRNDPRYFNGKHPFIQIGNLPREGGFVTAHGKTLNDDGLAVSRKFPKGTVVIAIVGATIGNTGVLAYDMCVTDSIVGIETGTQEGNRYMELFLRYEKHNIRQASYSSGGQPNINLEFLNPYPLALPPLSEQQEIVRRVDALFSLADRLEARYAKANVQTEKLTQAILAKAFRGELVPTEAELARRDGREYETAEQLLARIRSAGARTKGAGQRRAAGAGNKQRRRSGA